MDKIRLVVLLSLLLIFFGGFGMDIYGVAKTGKDLGPAIHRIIEHWTHNNSFTTFVVGLLLGHSWSSGKG